MSGTCFLLLVAMIQCSLWCLTPTRVSLLCLYHPYVELQRAPWNKEGTHHTNKYIDKCYLVIILDCKRWLAKQLLNAYYGQGTELGFYKALQDLPPLTHFLSDLISYYPTLLRLALLASLFLKPARYAPNLGSLHSCSLLATFFH